MMAEQRISRDALEKSWIIADQPITATVTARDGGLACSLASPAAIDDEREGATCRRVASFLSADDDLAEFYARADRDAGFAPVADRLRGLRQPRFGTPFEAACWGVINQRIQLAQARKLKAALVEEWGAEGCDAFPEPRTLARATERQLGAVLPHHRKARAVWSVAQAFAKVDERWLHAAPISDVDAWLRGIYGVGEFTAGFVLYRGLGRPITLSHGSFTARSRKLLAAAKKTYGPRFTASQLQAKGASYGRWFGLWSLYLWAHTLIDPPRGCHGEHKPNVAISVTLSL